MQTSTPPPATTAGRRGAALADLVSAIRQLEGLTRQVGPFSLPSGTCDQAQDLVTALCRELDIPLSFDAASGRERDYARTALAARIQAAQRAPELHGLDRDAVAALAGQARGIRDGQDAGIRFHRIIRPDGTLITALEAGPRDAPPVLLSPACAMPDRLSLRWLRALSTSHRCVVPQTRGTSEPIDGPGSFDERGCDVPSQAGDLVAVIEELGLYRAHVMGLCGGAVLALLAAAKRPELIASLSLWHADLELGPDAEKTEHQVNLRGLLDLAAESRDTAAWMRDRLVSGPMKGVPDGVGPLVVRPYATVELFYRYAKLTGATMHWDSRATAARVRQPCLIVTSRDDHTAHPAGSLRLAEILPDARLAVTEHGTHLDAFNATPEQVSCLSEFLTARPGR
jgi:3-oxoadipate enol-lactonase